MRWYFATALLQAAPILALPIPHRMLSSAQGSLDILEYNTETAYTKFVVSPGFQDDELTPLVFELQVDPATDPLSSSVSLNEQPLDITWIPGRHTQPPIIQPKTQSLSIPDRFGFSHSVQISLSGGVANRSEPRFPTKDVTQSIDLRLDSVDGIATRLGFIVITDPTAPLRLLRLSSGYSSDTIDFAQFTKSFMIADTVHIVTANEPVGYDGDDSFDIEAEIESLLLLEAEAGELHGAIAAKKEAIAKCLKDHRDNVTLRHLLQQCDGLVCAAKVIAQRICDKAGILTVPSVGYAKVQDPDMQNLIDLGEDNEKQSSEFRIASERYAKGTRLGSVHSAAAIQPLSVVYPQSALLRVLGVIAAAIGLGALFSLIRRKCMSMRRRVDRAADQEERRNRRAYRRAARRADMRRRWDSFVAAISCFRSEAEPRIEDYEEKRALILQDAFLEQDMDAAEKGEVMEAEIRELRHAQQIVQSLVGVDQNRYDLAMSVNDPPPSMVPLPYAAESRSRASTATLPSYHSESLPDYTSRYQRTETASSSSSLRSSSVAADGSDRFTLTSISEDGNYTGSTPRSFSPGGSHGSRRSRYTPTSSVIEVSPRASAETLRTNGRRSKDTNDL